MSHISQIRKHCQHTDPRPHFSHKQQTDTRGKPANKLNPRFNECSNSLCGDFLRQVRAFKNTADSHLRPNGQTAKQPNGRRPKQTTPRAPWPSLPLTPSLHSCSGFPPLSLSRCGFQTCHMHAPSDSRTAASLTVPAEMSAHHLLWSLTTAGLNCKKASADSCLHKIHVLNSALSLLPPLDKRQTSPGI